MGPTKAFSAPGWCVSGSIPAFDRPVRRRRRKEKKRKDKKKPEKKRKEKKSHP
eukprot:COSAG06_NODE_60216_length_271_cov_1.209302_1_plen_52_part_01